MGQVLGKRLIKYVLSNQNDIQYIMCSLVTERNTYTLKDRQHRRSGGSDFPFITQGPKGVEHRVVYQMKGNIYLYPMTLRNKRSRAN